MKAALRRCEWRSVMYLSLLASMMQALDDLPLVIDQFPLHHCMSFNLAVSRGTRGTRDMMSIISKLHLLLCQLLVSKYLSGHQQYSC